MAVPAFLLSFLRLRLVTLGASFDEKLGNAFLVWEPGAWHPSAPTHEATMVPNSGPQRPVQGDALAYVLPKVSPARIKVGRSSSNDLVLQDATVSREHLLVVSPESGRWLAEPLAPPKPVGFNRALLIAANPLQPGDKLTLGDCTLTFLDGAALRARLEPEG